MKLKIKVSGLREPDNIRAVLGLGIDMMGFVFCDNSPRNVQQLHVCAGTIPDRAGDQLSNCSLSDCKLVGIFLDEMPQNVVTRVYNYNLDYVQLQGNESTIYIENLRNTLIPDIAPNIKIIKTIIICTADDLNHWREYEGHVDMLIFDIHRECNYSSDKHIDLSLLNNYEGNIPFLLSGDIDPEEASLLKTINHPMFMGVDLDSQFEDAPAFKNIDKLKEFIGAIRS